ncbi:PucR family transcriptional regulator [Mycolicibacterium komossense]|uniref:PucR family transcriptional regulator n=1 Tax=Mycolicibacterium komossense TaxID=1779 RepID=A0ABT3CHF0_9MYCO|nr:PucR family transcriptional regulator [Mycolicibacterium komossense]MCV7228959.1 PucR family transcriptional regulator [Mycolicibacterium komossense]
MQPTVREILELPVVTAGAPEVVLGGAPNRDALDQPVRWVHVSDLADLSNLLEGGELVLTTGQALSDPAHRAEYLPRLAAAGAVAVVVELGLHVDAVPADVLDAGRGLGLAVIVLHRPVRFVEVTEQVHRRIVAEQYAEVDYTRRVHEVFTSLSMSRASLDEIVASAADILATPIVLEDLNRQVLAFAGHGVPTAELLADWDRRSRLTPELGAGSWAATPVGPYRQEWGRLVAPNVPGPGERSVSTTLERAAQALVLHRMIEQDRTSLELRAQGGLVEDLRRGRIHDEADATSRAYALGLRPALTYVPASLRWAEGSGVDQVIVQQRRARTLDAVVHAIRSTGHTVLAAGSESGQIDLLLAPQRTTAGAGLSTAILGEVCGSIRRAVVRIEGIASCVIGIGPESSRLLDAAGGLAEAAHVAEVAMAMPTHVGDGTGDKSFYRAADVRLRGMVGLIRSDPRVQAFAETELRGLLEYRAKHGGPGVQAYELLRSFLDVGGNKTELAKRTHLSRPTLYARLAALQRLLGVDLDDAESRTSLHVAMLILESRQRAGDIYR